MNPNDLIQTARDLLITHNGTPNDANIRRALSTLYYALFHTLAQSCADLLVGMQKDPDTSKHAWRQVYRSLEHGIAKSACNNKDMRNKFPEAIQDFANLFINLQEERHQADYDPFASVYSTNVNNKINQAEVTIENYLNCTTKDKRAFSAYVLLKSNQKRQ